MNDGNEHEMDGWKIVSFPASHLRQEFLGQIQLWNSVEGLPRIETSPLNDGTRLRFRTVGGRQVNIHRLIEAFGGVVVRDVPEVA